MHRAPRGASGRERIGSGCARPDDAGGIHLTQKELDSLREQIDKIDSEILRMVQQREGVALELGLTKEKDGLDLRDRRREKQVIDQFARKARAMGIDAVFASILAELLISDALRAQKYSKVPPLSGKSALVVGGSGKMGEWFCRFLSNRGAAVTVWDRRGKLEGYPEVKALDKKIRDRDMVIIASPLGASLRDLESVLRCSPRGLVFDVCSVKAHISQTLRRAAAKGVRITSVHPMFGPGAPSPRGLNVLVCDCGCDDANDSARRIFSNAGGLVSIVDLDRHDDLMAYVLGLPHLCTLLFPMTAAKSGHAFKEFDRARGPSFERHSRAARELAGESRRVYHDIQALNPNTEEMLTNLNRAVQEIRKASLDDDSRRFRKIMDDSRDYLEVI